MYSFFFLLFVEEQHYQVDLNLEDITGTSIMIIFQIVQEIQNIYDIDLKKVGIIRKTSSQS